MRLVYKKVYQTDISENSIGRGTDPWGGQSVFRESASCR